MSAIGAEIKRLREERGWSQAQLAVYAGSSQPTVNQIETGKRNPSTRTLEKLAGALGVEVADLFPKAPAPLQLELEAAAGTGGRQRREGEDKERHDADINFRRLADTAATLGERVVLEFSGQGDPSLEEDHFDMFIVASGTADYLLKLINRYGPPSDEAREVKDRLDEVESRVSALVRQFMRADEKEWEERSRFTRKYSNGVSEIDAMSRRAELDG